MSDFWAKKLGQVAPQQQVQQPVQPPAPARPWWQPQAAPQPQTVAPQQPGQPAYSGVPGSNQQSNIMDLLNQENYTTTKAKSNDGSFCPECGSGNFVRIAGRTSPTAPRRCFNCGYNELGYQHTTAGLSATSDNVPTYDARVQKATSNNFNPQHVIAHVNAV